MTTNGNLADELKPCPFCHCADVRHDHPNRAPRVYCSRCRSSADSPEIWNARHHWVLTPDLPCDDPNAPTPAPDVVVSKVLRIAQEELNNLGADPLDVELAWTRLNQAALASQPSPDVAALVEAVAAMAMRPGDENDQLNHCIGLARKLGGQS